MKKLLAVAVSALAISSAANADWYVQGDLGYSKLKFTEYSNLSRNRFEPRLSVGYKLNDWRFALDYSNYGKFSGDDESLKIHGLGVSSFYDFDLSLPVKPYIGVRLSTNYVDISSNTDPRKFVKLGYGLLTGVSYNIDKNLALNAGIEYNRLGAWEDTKLNQYGAKVGLRYEF